MRRACLLTSTTVLLLAWPDLARAQDPVQVPVPLVADHSEIGAYERDATPPAIGTAPPRILRQIDPVWPLPVSERWRFRVHLVLDAEGKVAESRIVQTLVGDPAARPVGPQGDVAPALRTSPSARAGLAVLAAVRQWQFEAPGRVPMLIVTDVGIADDVPVSTMAGEPRFGTPLKVGGDVPPPTKIVNVPPRYPADALQARASGLVTIEAVIAPSGDVIEARVVSGVPLLDDAALEAVRQWRYTPTVINGVAVPVTMTVTVNFSLAPRK